MINNYNKFNESKLMKEYPYDIEKYLRKIMEEYEN